MTWVGTRASRLVPSDSIAIVREPVRYRMSVLFGRFFQMVGMVLLPVGLYLGSVRDNIALEVRLLFIGGAFFVVGWLMARRKS